MALHCGCVSSCGQTIGRNFGRHIYPVATVRLKFGKAALKVIAISHGFKDRVACRRPVLN